MTTDDKTPKSRRKPIILSIISAIALLALCYIVNNLSYSITDGANIGQRIEQLKMMSSDTEDSIPDELCLINVAYDRQLIPLIDSIQGPKGNIDITDRDKLVRLLNELKTTNYKYIVLDVAFEKGYDSPADSVLFPLIASMDKIVVSKSNSKPIASDLLLPKLSSTDYSIHIAESNFVKYDYIRNGQPTLPYRMYLDLHGNPISSHGGVYFFNGHPAYKSVVLRHPVRLEDPLKPDSDANYAAEQKYYNLGVDFLDPDFDISRAVDGKIVVIGDFTENDFHDTYLGRISGPIININAYYALVNDNLSIPYSLIIFLFLFYALLSYCIIRRVSVFKSLPVIKHITSKTIRLIISFISVTTLMAIVSALLYIFFNLDLNITIPSLYFSLLITIVNIPNRIDKINKI